MYEYYLKDIEKMEGTNGFNAVSTFSGAGGSCMGLKLAGFNVLWANEFIPAAQEVYKMNHKNTILDKRDIRTINYKEILNKCNLKQGELDLFEGSPPCAAFSIAGKGDKCWGKVKKYSDTKQRVDDLFIEYARLLKGLKPKMFITENVDALGHKQNKTYFNTIYSHLVNCGYTVKAYILNSMFYNVPQKRKRLFFIGTRNDLNIVPNAPDPNNNIITVKQAIPFYKKYVHEELNINPKTKAYTLLKYAQRHKLDNLGTACKKLYNKNSYFTYNICQEHKVSPTLIVGSPLFHEYYPRPVSISEAKRLQTFPDDYRLSGTYQKQWERIARSVPPRMMEALATKIKQTLEGV